jgi:hypothetical protein
MSWGDIAVLDAGDRHPRVHNASDGITISLRVYRLDYQAAGTSSCTPSADRPTG